MSDHLDLLYNELRHNTYQAPLHFQGVTFVTAYGENAATSVLCLRQGIYSRMRQTGR
jgi:hypothetical protein